MSGNRLLLDTNAVVSLLKGDPSSIALIIHATWIGISIISHIEFLAFDDLSKQDLDLYNSFAHRVTIIGINNENTELLHQTIKLRKKYGIKLPDALIAATALTSKASLVTGDKLLLKIKEVKSLQI